MNVEQLAAARGRTVEEVLAACRAANVLAWSGFTPLDDTEVAAVDGALQRSTGGPFVAPGTGGPPAPMPPPRPGTALPPPGWGPQGQHLPPKKGRNPLVVVGIVVVVLVALGVAANATGLVDKVQDEATRQAIDDVEGAGFDDDVDPTLGIYALAVGDCFEDLSGTATAIDTVEARVDEVECGLPHDAEVYLLGNHPEPTGAPYPGEDAAFAFAADQCLAAFQGFVGTPYEASSLDAIVVTPLEVSWERIDDRQYICSIVARDGSPLTGTMAGSGR